MNRAAVASFGIFLSLLPSVAFAAERTTWDFQNNNVPGEWEVTGTFSAESQPDGVHITANDDGTFTQMIDLPHRIDVIALTVSAQTPTDMMIVWHPNSLPAGALGQRQIRIPAGTLQHVTLDMSMIGYWDPHTDTLGIALPKGANIVLQRMDVEGYSFFERVLEAVRTFWTFDTFSSYTINFLWGPLLTFNETGRLHLFDNLPPLAQSANRYFYFILALTAIGLLLHRFYVGMASNASADSFRKRAPYAFLFFFVFGALWILYDLRMGLEYFSYAKTDIGSHMMKREDRIFRGFLSFYTTAERAATVLATEERYAVFSPKSTPFMSIMRYYTYPSAPLLDGEAITPGMYYVVILRPDISISAEGRLISGDTPISPPGDLIEDYGDASFLFRARP